MFEEVHLMEFFDGTKQLIQSVRREDGLYQDLILTEENELLWGDIYLPF